MLPSAAPNKSAQRRLLVGWILLAAIPIIYIGLTAAEASRNIAFWDEIDTALVLVLEINRGAPWQELARMFFAVDNEHRTVTSRIIYALSYWTTGTINFHVITAIGNFFLVGAVATLVLAVSGWERRIRMGVVLVFVVFQLEHFESFIWSGSSIDHFQVVMLAMLALAALVRGTRATAVVGAGSAILATFTLAQGLVLWPLGGLLLAFQRRWRTLGAWAFVASAILAVFFYDFSLNPEHHVRGFSAEKILGVASYWLRLLGAPLTLGESNLWTPWLGASLLATLGFLGSRQMAQRQPLALYGACFAVGALALIAIGRVELAAGLGSAINSRYLILGALAWALVIFLLLELAVEAAPSRPLRPLAALLPALVAFNLSANIAFAPKITSFNEVRDRAATSFKQFKADGKGVTRSRLHPQESHADIILAMAERRGVYRLPTFSSPTNFTRLQPNNRIIAHVDETFTNDEKVTIGGWAMRADHTSKRGQIHVLLRSPSTQLTFSSVTLQRSDVAAAYRETKWNLAGFRAVINRRYLPAENFEIGVIISDGRTKEFIMTGQRLELARNEKMGAITGSDQ